MKEEIGIFKVSTENAINAARRMQKIKGTEDVIGAELASASLQIVIDIDIYSGRATPINYDMPDNIDYAFFLEKNKPYVLARFYCYFYHCKSCHITFCPKKFKED